MLDKLEQKLKRFDELQRLMADPGVIANQAEYKKYAKEKYGAEVFIPPNRPPQGTEPPL